MKPGLILASEIVKRLLPTRIRGKSLDYLRSTPYGVEVRLDIAVRAWTCTPWVFHILIELVAHRRRGG